MKLYQLHIAPGEHDHDGENLDEWFTSLKAARKRRHEILADARASTGSGLFKYGEDLSIDEITFAKRPQRELLLRVLNRRGYVEKRVQVVPPAKL